MTGLVVAVVVMGTIVFAYVGWQKVHRPRPGSRSWVGWCRSRWPSDCRHLGLVLVDKTRLVMAKTPHQPRVVAPRATFTRNRNGLTVTMKTVPGVGFEELVREAPHLANIWGCVRVTVDQVGPGRLKLFGLVSEPLAIPLGVEVNGEPLKDWRLRVGVDENGEEATLDLANLSGVTVAGVPGTGKTSLMRWWWCQLAAHPAVELAVLDGKVEDPSDGDYGRLLGRCRVFAGDGLADANRALEWLYQTMRDRSGWLRAHRGTSQFWDDGPSVDCPVVVTIVDESHAYMSSGSRADKDAVESNVRYLTKLAKEGRSRGFITVFVTQKQTADAIPTAIRDVCQVGISFGVRTTDGAVAALGDDIRNHPDVSPTLLIDRAWTGVCVMRTPDRVGYRRVRCPYVTEDQAADVSRIPDTIEAAS